MSSGYQANSVANFIIDRAKQGRVHGLTNMKMQRLLFIIEAWHREIYGYSLIQDIFSMWPHGPVIPSLYHLIKLQKSEHLVKNLSTFQQGRYLMTTRVNENDDEAIKLIDKVLETYDQYTGTQLANIVWANIPRPNEGEPITANIFKAYIDKMKNRTVEVKPELKVVK